MTREEKLTRIEELKDRIFRIEIGSDFLSHDQHMRLTAYYTELNELKKEVQDEQEDK